MAQPKSTPNRAFNRKSRFDLQRSAPKFNWLNSLERKEIDLGAKKCRDESDSNQNALYLN
ncbi:uncharacterized protein G2W53_005621 [Senna tora]|uniref:Uncharacterized protein n=1 Tax=Senna tora TaxID=362788 RepID=A0A834X3D1_9FABA|nr:uncharacterized protein G2W53_005621 [Senna tora]